MHTPVLLPLVIAAAAILLALHYRAQKVRLARAQFIRNHVFQASLFESFRRKHPALSDKDVFLVARALREYFLVYLRAGNRTIGMPSRVVDDLWHEFILSTHAYARFCKGAFGRFLHHIPATENTRRPAIRDGMAVTWRLACLEENINPRYASRLPLLFAIDDKLEIEGGYSYSLNEIVARYNSQRSDSTAGSGCSASTGSNTDADACAEGGSDGGGDSGGDSGGDGGGCGGGCGGGGD